MINYMFEEVQQLRCVVYDADEGGDSSTLDLSKQDKVGEVDFKLPDLVRCRDNAKLDLLHKNEKCGELVIKCEEVNQSSGDVVCKFHLNGYSRSTFLRISNIQRIYFD